MRGLVLVCLCLFAMFWPDARAGDDLYHRLGEKAGLTRIASRTVDNAMADERIKAAFVDTNVPRLKGLLALFLCKTVDGPCTYPGRSMEEAHKGIGARDMHFNALVENLQKAMDAENIGFATQNELLALLAPMHGDVVKR